MSIFCVKEIKLHKEGRIVRVCTCVLTSDYSQDRRKTAFYFLFLKACFRKRLYLNFFLKIGEFKANMFFFLLNGLLSFLNKMVRKGEL